VWSGEEKRREEKRREEKRRRKRTGRNACPTGMCYGF
jgi:hypothetical protein